MICDTDPIGTMKHDECFTNFSSIVNGVNNLVLTEFL